MFFLYLFVCNIQEGRGHLDVFLLVYLTTLGKFILFLLVGSVSKVSKRFNYYFQSTERVSSVGMYINLSPIVLSL